MSIAAPLQADPPKSQALGNSSRANLPLQRKCACGSPASSLSGECAECKGQKRLQTKLTIGASNDALELEADRIADQAMAAPAPSPSKRVLPHIQRYTAQPSAQAHAPVSVDRVLAGTGSPLAPALRQDMEQRFGHDFSQVRTFHGSAAETSARDIGAAAYTVGSNIVFGANRFSPNTPTGRHLLAHELTHVVQQGGAGERVVRRSLAGCADLLRNPSAVSLVSGQVVHRLIGAHFMRTVQGARTVAIPGASAGPLRSQGICGGDTKVINPQLVGGMSGAGLPDLARTTQGGILQVAEIKPAAIPCLIDGEEQALRYIDQGNARDPAQAAWRASQGVTVVTPMPESAYRPPQGTLTVPGVARAELKTAWCAPGLMAYTVNLSGQPISVPVPQTSRERERARLRDEARRRALAVGTGGVAVAVAAVAGRALWSHFWRVVIQRFAVRGAIAAALSAADGPLPFGELISLGMALVTAVQIIDGWHDIWREADRIAAEGA